MPAGLDISLIILIDKKETPAAKKKISKESTRNFFDDDENEELEVKEGVESTPEKKRMAPVRRKVNESGESILTMSIQKSWKTLGWYAANFS